MRRVNWPLARRVPALLAAGAVALSLAVAGCGADEPAQRATQPTPSPAPPTPALSPQPPPEPTASEPPAPSPVPLPEPTPLVQPWLTSIEGVEVTLTPEAIETLAKALPKALEGTPDQSFVYELDSPLDLQIRQAVAAQLVMAEGSLQDSHVVVVAVTDYPGAIQLIWPPGCPAVGDCETALSQTTLPVQVIKETANSPDRFLAIGPPEGAAWVSLDEL